MLLHHRNKAYVVKKLRNKMSKLEFRCLIYVLMHYTVPYGLSTQYVTNRVGNLIGIGIQVFGMTYCTLRVRRSLASSSIINPKYQTPAKRV